MKATNPVEILLVEDNPADVELTLRALKKHNLANRVHVVTDGAQALDYLFPGGDPAKKTRNSIPKVIFLDLKLPKVDGREVLRRLKADARTKIDPGGGADLFQGGERYPGKLQAWESTATWSSPWISTSSWKRLPSWGCTGY